MSDPPSSFRVVRNMRNPYTKAQVFGEVTADFVCLVSYGKQSDRLAARRLCLALEGAVQLVDGTRNVRVWSSILRSESGLTGGFSN